MALTVQIYMTMDGIRSSVLCAQGTAIPVLHISPAPDVLRGYFHNKPMPAHENGVIAGK